MDEHNIGLVRRETGGGAIYLDDRNMSFFLLNAENANDIFGNYQKLYAPMVQALEKLGVEGLEQKGRNDLTLRIRLTTIGIGIMAASRSSNTQCMSALKA